VSSYDLDGSSTTKEGTEKLGIREIVREEIVRYFQDPLGYEEEFKGWIPEWITTAGIDVPIGQVIGFSQYVVKLVDLNVFPTSISHTNWDTIAMDASAMYGAFKRTDNTNQNNEINFDVSLSAGTWTVELCHTTANNVGIYTVTVGDVAAGTVDGYSAGTTYNIRSQLTGIIVPQAGVHRLKLKMATKNASSSAYRGQIQNLQLRRTD
jgi:hypothetical protein